MPLSTHATDIACPVPQPVSRNFLNKPFVTDFKPQTTEEPHKQFIRTGPQQQDSATKESIQWHCSCNACVETRRIIREASFERIVSETYIDPPFWWETLNPNGLLPPRARERTPIPGLGLPPQHPNQQTVTGDSRSPATSFTSGQTTLNNNSPDGATLMPGSKVHHPEFPITNSPAPSEGSQPKLSPRFKEPRSEKPFAQQQYYNVNQKLQRNFPHERLVQHLEPPTGSAHQHINAVTASRYHHSATSPSLTLHSSKQIQIPIASRPKQLQNQASHSPPAVPSYPKDVPPAARPGHVPPKASAPSTSKTPSPNRRNPTRTANKPGAWRANLEAHQDQEMEKNARFLIARGQDVTQMSNQSGCSRFQNANAQAQMLRELQHEMDRQNGRGKKGTRWYRQQ